VLSKKFRLTKKQDFGRVSRTGKFFGEKFLAIKVVLNNLPVSRFAFIVSLKVSKKSTERNLVRRRMSECVRLKMPEIALGYDVVFFTRAEIVHKNYREIKQAVMEVLRKAKLINVKCQSSNIK